MCRTTINVSGDCMVAVIVDHFEQIEGRHKYMMPLELDSWGVPSLTTKETLESAALELMVQYPKGKLSTGQEVKDIDVLDLRGLPLQKLPCNIHHLEGLEALYLSDNGLQQLPDNIVHLPKLKTLSLGRNQISSLPKRFMELWDSLVYLFLGHNQISSLPFDESEMACLRIEALGQTISEPIGTVLDVRGHAKNTRTLELFGGLRGLEPTISSRRIYF